MVHTYAAIFTDDEKGNCHISIPNLEYETYIDYSSHSDLMAKASQELGFALWLYETAGRMFPNPSTISDKELPDDGYIGFITCDYDKYKQSMTVKAIPID